MADTGARRAAASPRRGRSQDGEQSSGCGIGAATAARHVGRYRARCGRRQWWRSDRPARHFGDGRQARRYDRACHRGRIDDRGSAGRRAKADRHRRFGAASHPQGNSADGWL